MAAASPSPSPRHAAPVAAGPFADFVGPGRRRTDHPLVIGTLVLSVGTCAMVLLAVFGVLLWIAVLLRDGNNLQRARYLVEDARNDKVDAATDAARDRTVKSQESMAKSMLRICLKFATSDAETKECVAEAKLPPAPPLLAPKATTK